MVCEKRMAFGHRIVEKSKGMSVAEAPFPSSLLERAVGNGMNLHHLQWNPHDENEEIIPFG